MSRFIALLVLVTAWSTTLAASRPLIPRDVLFGNGARFAPSLSPDGKSLAWLARDQRGDLQVWAQTIGREDARQVTPSGGQSVDEYLWTEDSAEVLYLHDEDGNENYHLNAANALDGAVRQLTPFEGLRTTLVSTHRSTPREVVVTLNLRNRESADVYRVSLDTGALTPETTHLQNVLRWQLDAVGRVRGAVTQDEDGTTHLQVRSPGRTIWRSIIKVPLEENVLVERMGFIGFSRDGEKVFAKSPLGADTLRVIEVNLRTGEERVLAEDPHSDVLDVLFDARTQMVQAAAFERNGRRRWRVLDKRIARDFDAIAAAVDGDFSVVDRDREDRRWLIAVEQDRVPTSFYLYERRSRRTSKLFSTRPELSTAALAAMQPIVVTARDGLKLPGFLTLPVADAQRNLPMVLLVHGGPWGQDTWGFRPEVQWLANRGYAVLQVNFRASSGYGKKFLNAGNRQWGDAMQNDLVDAVKWAVDAGYADAGRVAIMGSSYGGYAALAGAAFNHGTFKCSVDAFGISNLLTFLSSFPPQWKVIQGMYRQRVGDVGDPAERERLKRASPFFAAANIRVPVLVAQGGNDPRVKQAESDQIVEALKRAGQPVTYVLYPDEGHGFSRTPNRLDFYARVEAFLAQHLGGRAEPVTVAGVPGTSAKVTAHPQAAR